MTKVYFGLDKFQRLENAVVTSGTFDGVHDGHRVIFERIKNIANEINGESVVLTFWPHPRLVLNQNASELKLLSTLDEKVALLKQEGIDHVIILPFTKSFSQKSSLAFIQEIFIDRIGTRKLVIGYDHKFGKNREGSFEYIRNHPEEFPFTVEEIPRQDLENIGISSSIVRASLLSGNVAKAAMFLGRHYGVEGKVVMGEQVGRKIGFPTANITVEEVFKLIPMDGVYAVKVVLDEEEYKGMLNIGVRPTLEGKHKSIEVNIFDFNQEIYGKKLRLYFFDLIRKERKFANLSELQEQLIKDKNSVEQILAQ